MKYCEKCGKQIEDEATVCMGCGCPVKAKQGETITATIKKKFNKKLLYVVIPIALVAVLVLGILYIRFWREIDAEITLDDLTKPSSTTSALLKYGAPGSAKYDHYFYFKSVTLEGVELESFRVYFEEGQSYDESYSIMMDYGNSAELIEMLNEKTDLVSGVEKENYIAGVKDYVFTFEYDDIEIILETIHVTKDDASCRVYFICD